jgi:hypothetical protein
LVVFLFFVFLLPKTFKLFWLSNIFDFASVLDEGYSRNVYLTKGELRIWLIPYYQRNLLWDLKWKCCHKVVDFSLM